MPQRRRRIFILGYHKTSPIYSKLKNIESQDWILKKGLIAEAFPITSMGEIQFQPLEGGLVDISEDFNSDNEKNPFENSGLMVDGKCSSVKTASDYDGPFMVLNDVLQNGQVPSEYFLDENDLEKWEYLKGAKTIERQSANGHVYKYSEGGMNYPDPLNKPSRTIITGEGGKSPSRFKHVIHTPKGLRRLTPIELERLNMFPDNHTRLEGISDSKRAFFMGNALVVGVIERLAEVMEKRLKPT